MLWRVQHLLGIQILILELIEEVFAAPAYHREKSCDVCSSSLYYCKKFSEGEFGCEMDKTMLIAVVILALITGIVLPIACVSLYVCGFYSWVINYLTSSVKRPEDVSLLERDFRRDGDTLPSVSQPSIESIKPIERKFKKNPNRFSQPQCELLSEIGRRSASTDM